MRKGGADRTEPRADRFDGNVEEANHERSRDQRYERTRNAAADPRPQRHDQQSGDRQGQSLSIDRVQIGGKGAPLRNELRRHLTHAQPQKILYLARENDDRYSTGEPDDDRMRNELDCGAELGDAKRYEYQTGHDRRHDEAVDSVSLDNSVDDDDECASRPADLHTRAAEGGDQESSNDRRVEAAVGSDTAGDCERDCEGESDYADNDAGDQIRSELRSAIRPEGRYGFRDEQEGNLAIKPMVAAESYCPFIGLLWEPARNHLRGRRGPN